MFDFDSYHKAYTVEEAIALLVEHPQAIPLAGGTDVLVRLHQNHPDYRHLVDIHDVAELKTVVMLPDETISVGSGATFTQLMESEIITANIPILAEAAATVGGPQIRNMATVGGNICNGVPSADSAAPLLVLNAKVVLKGPRGERSMPLHAFYKGPGQVDLKPAEIMISLQIAPDNYRGWSTGYYKYAMRDAMDIATIGCAAGCRLEREHVADLRLAFTVAGPTPLRCWKTEEKAYGMRADWSLLRLVRESVLNDLKPRDSWRASKDFREHIIKTLTERVLHKVINQCGVDLS
jgi:xanthine dehydrogenase FAD-binding subunit